MDRNKKRVVIGLAMLGLAALIYVKTKEKPVDPNPWLSGVVVPYSGGNNWPQNI